jgi:hypothetical protein
MTNDNCGGRPTSGLSAAAATVIVERPASESVGTNTIGERFAAAIASKDVAALTGMLVDDVDFRAMTPGRFWEANSASDVANTILGHWFAPSDHIEAIEQLDTDGFADCQKVSYRFRVTNPVGTFTVEQQAYFTAIADRIVWLRLMCSGYRSDTSDSLARYHAGRSAAEPSPVQG